jgi:hypothetical protein
VSSSPGATLPPAPDGPSPALFLKMSDSIIWNPSMNFGLPRSSHRCNSSIALLLNVPYLKSTSASVGAPYTVAPEVEPAFLIEANTCASGKASQRPSPSLAMLCITCRHKNMGGMYMSDPYCLKHGNLSNCIILLICMPWNS